MGSGTKSPVHDNFNDYLKWVTLAARASYRPRSATALRNAISQDWDEYAINQRVAFAAGVRRVWDERRDLGNANEYVHAALVGALNVVPSDVKNSHRVLQMELKYRQDCLAAMLDALKNLNRWQDVQYDGAFKASLTQYVRHAIGMYELQATNTRTWREFNPTTIRMGRT